MPVIIALYYPVFGELRAPQEILERQVCLLSFSGVWYVPQAAGWLVPSIPPTFFIIWTHVCKFRYEGLGIQEVIQ